MNKKLSIIILAAICVLALCAGTACAKKPASPSESASAVRELQSITLNTDGVQKIFQVGSQFNSDGLIVTANYNALPLTEVVTDYAVTPPDTSTEGAKTVKVTYKSKTAEYVITVNARGPVTPVRSLQSITLNTDGVQKNFTVGDAFNADGLIVIANYNLEPLTVTVTEYRLSSPDMNTVGEKTVTVFYETATASYTISVSDVPTVRTLLSLTLDLTSVKQIFEVGEEFTYAGLKVTANYNTSPTAVEITDFKVNYDEIDTDILGPQTVIVSYGGLISGYEILVTPVRTLLGIEINTDDVKKEYELGDVFTYEGLKVIARYNAAPTTVEITEFSVTPPDMTSPGTKTVIVGFGGKTAEYEIIVYSGEREVRKLSVDASEARKIYKVGETFAPEGVVVTATYNKDPLTETVGEGSYSFSAPDVTSVGEKVVTISYEGKSATYTIVVIPSDEMLYKGYKIETTGETASGFKNFADTEDRLTLLVTDIINGVNGQASYTYGWYLLERADGSVELFPFETFHQGPSGNWITTHPSNGYSAMQTSNSGNLFASYDGLTFEAGADLWHQKVLDWINSAGVYVNSKEAESLFTVGDTLDLTGLSVTVANRADGGRSSAFDISEANAENIQITSPSGETRNWSENFVLSEVGAYVITFVNGEDKAEYTVAALPAGFDAEENTVNFTDNSSGTELTMFVTERDGGTARGYIVARLGVGELMLTEKIEVYEMTVSLADSSADCKGASVAVVGGSLTVSVCGVSFTAEADWLSKLTAE